MRRLLVMLPMIGCGRINFDAPPPDGIASTSDADAADGPPVNIALVQIRAPGFQSAASVVVTFPQTAGNLLVAAIYWDQSPNTITIADSAGQVWTALPQQEVLASCGGGTGNATGARLYYAQVTSSTTNAVTATQTSGNQPFGLMVAEYSGLAQTNVVDTQAGQGAPGSSNTMAAPALTTTTDDLIVAFFNDTILTGAMGGGTGYTVEVRDTGFPNMYEDLIGPAGTYTPDGTLVTGQSDACWVALAVAFRHR